MRTFLPLLAIVSLSFAAAGCKKADTVNRASLEDGKTYTQKLKFWMKNRGAVGNDLVDNAHFDDGANTRVVFTYAPALNDAIGKLKQGSIYKVTYTFKKAMAAPNVGELTKVE